MRSKPAAAVAALLVPVALVLPLLTGCGKSASSNGASSPHDKSDCTAQYDSGGTAHLKISDQGSSLGNPTITVLVGGTGLSGGKITISFPSWAPPAAINGQISATVSNGRAVLPLNPHLQTWKLPGGAVPLVVRASGKGSNGKEESAECDVRPNLAKLLRRVRDCFTSTGKRLYDIAVTIVGSLEKWYFIVYEGAVEGGYRVPTRGGASSYVSEAKPTGLRVIQIRRVRDEVTGKLREVRTLVRFGELSEEFGQNDSFKLQVDGPGRWSCVTNWISLLSKG